MEKYDDFEAIYETMIGQRIPEYAVPGVENMADGVTPYSQAWRQLLKSRDALCRRFSIHPEDPDLEQMINAVTTIEREIARGIHQFFHNAYTVGEGH